MSTDQAMRVDREQLLRLVREEEAQLVEVLSKWAFDALHLPGAINLPLEEVDEKGTQVLDRGKPVIVYCFDYL